MRDLIQQGFSAVAIRYLLLSVPYRTQLNFTLDGLRGREPPYDINVVIEIPQGSSVKYEVDKASGAVFVDRFLFTPTAYPAAYGFIPGTLALDGDPADALVLTPAQVVPGAVIRSRPIGMLLMEDEAGHDEKIICVPHDSVHPQHTTVKTVGDLAEITRIDGADNTYEQGQWYTLRLEVGPADRVALSKNGQLIETARRRQKQPLWTAVSPGDGYSEGRVEIAAMRLQAGPGA